MNNKNKIMENISKYLSFILFFGLLIALPVITFLIPKEDFSEVENRTLSKFPKLTVQSVFNRDRKFMNGVESYLADHFVGRNTWIQSKTQIELMSGKKEMNGVFVLNDRLVQKMEAPDKEKVDRSLNAIVNFAKENNIPTFFMLAPTSGGIYYDELPENSGAFDQKSWISDCYNYLSDKGVTTLDVFTPLSSDKGQDIYYRNDHHWTTYGAYVAYYNTIKKMGFQPVELKNFDIEHASDSFKGSLYSKALYDGIAPDVLNIYYGNGSKITKYIVNDGMKTTEYDSFYFREYLDKKDKYSVFGGTNQPVTEIITDNPSGKSILIFKDSYAHCYVPFLAEHYSKITMLDMRYINLPYRYLVDVEAYDQALFLFNAVSFSEDAYLRKLDDIK